MGVKKSTKRVRGENIDSTTLCTPFEKTGMSSKPWQRRKNPSTRLNRFFHLGKNRNRSNRFFAIYCDLLRFIAIFCDFLRFFLRNQIRHREKNGKDLKDLLPSMGSLLGTVESSK